MTYRLPAPMLVEVDIVAAAVIADD